MRCLNCNTEMTNYDVVTKSAELSYDVCEKCGSLWLDRGELDKMAFQVAGSIEVCSEQETDRWNLGRSD
jgi:Zn-finger nucleic acid-binding protein